MHIKTVLNGYSSEKLNDYFNMILCEFCECESISVLLRVRELKHLAWREEQKRRYIKLYKYRLNR